MIPRSRHALHSLTPPALAGGGRIGRYAKALMLTTVAMSAAWFTPWAVAEDSAAAPMELPPPLGIQPSDRPPTQSAGVQDMIIIYKPEDTVPDLDSAPMDRAATTQGAPSDEFSPIPQEIDFDIRADTMQFIPLGRVTFTSGAWALSDTAKKALDNVSSYLAAHPGAARLLLDGHADKVGGNAYNDTLSDKRAMAVESYLASKGVKPGLIHWRGHGKRAPADENWTRLGRERNRQVELFAVYLPQP